MLIKDLYKNTEKNLLLFENGNPDVHSFINIADDIYRLILSNNITYKDLSNEGKLHHHLVNVAILSGNLGILYNLDKIYSLILGGLLHDIGKLYIANSLLNKKSTLTEIERLILKEHTTIGYKIVSYFISDKITRDVVLRHHSILNNIKNNTDIYSLEPNDRYPLVCAMADIIDAILSYRPYKKPLSIDVIYKTFDNKGLINYGFNLNLVLGVYSDLKCQIKY